MTFTLELAPALHTASFCYAKDRRVRVARPMAGSLRSQRHFRYAEPDEMRSTSFHCLAYCVFFDAQKVTRHSQRQTCRSTRGRYTVDVSATVTCVVWQPRKSPKCHPKGRHFRFLHYWIFAVPA